MELEPAAIEERASCLMMAMKDDRGETAEKDLTAEAAWPAEGLRIAGPKMGAGMEAASNGGTVSENNLAVSSRVLRRHVGLHA